MSPLIFLKRKTYRKPLTLSIPIAIGTKNLQCKKITKLNTPGFYLVYLFCYYSQDWAKLHFGYMMKYEMQNVQEKCMNAVIGLFLHSMVG